MRSHDQALKLLVAYAVNADILRTSVGETVEDSVFRWIRNEPAVNPVPLVNTPFIYSRWKRDFLKWYGESNEIERKSAYARTCYALMQELDSFV